MTLPLFFLYIIFCFGFINFKSVKYLLCIILFLLLYYIKLFRLLIYSNISQGLLNKIERADF